MIAIQTPTELPTNLGLTSDLIDSFMSKCDININKLSDDEKKNRRVPVDAIFNPWTGNRQPMRLRKSTNLSCSKCGQVAECYSWQFCPDCGTNYNICKN